MKNFQGLSRVLRYFLASFQFIKWFTVFQVIWHASESPNEDGKDLQIWLLLDYLSLQRSICTSCPPPIQAHTQTVTTEQKVDKKVNEDCFSIFLSSLQLGWEGRCILPPLTWPCLECLESLILHLLVCLCAVSLLHSSYWILSTVNTSNNCRHLWQPEVFLWLCVIFDALLFLLYGHS